MKFSTFHLGNLYLKNRRKNVNKFSITLITYAVERCSRCFAEAARCDGRSKCNARTVPVVKAVRYTLCVFTALFWLWSRYFVTRRAPPSLSRVMLTTSQIRP